MPPGPKVRNPPDKPLLIYDGECRFCCFWVERWKVWTAGQVDFVASQDAETIAKYPEIPPEAYDQAVQLIQPNGATLSGAAAVAESLSGCYPIVRKICGSGAIFSYFAEWAYAVVARNRGLLSRIWRGVHGSHIEVPSYGLTSWIILRGLALIYLIAFLSLWSQIIPLSGENGIQPVAQLMQGLEKSLMAEGFGAKLWRVPTLFWISHSDEMLGGVCLAGVVLSGVAFLGVCTRMCLIGLWVCYLSLVHVCSPWLNFQWDILLLEAGVIGIFLARGDGWENPLHPKSPRFLPLLLMRWLVFRLMFASGMVKLLSRDEVWWNLTALTVHYETQPLPNPIAWHLHQMPVWFHQIGCGIMFGIELILPFFIFLPRRLRLLAAGSTVALMLVIIASGNYTFFNLLTIVISVSLLDDRAVKMLLPSKIREKVGPPVSSADCGKVGRWSRAGCTASFCVVTLLLSTVHMLPMFGLGVPKWCSSAALPVRQFLLVNGYGLFANMTERRPEIVFEGSNDGVTWESYELPYKPGNLSRRPPIIAPHQPRLDWQMWFAALGAPQHNPWLQGVVVGLLKGNEQVISLFSHNPFPDEPPRYMRGVYYDYKFTTRAERDESGNWWKREELGLYFNPVSIRPASPDHE